MFIDSELELKKDIIKHGFINRKSQIYKYEKQKQKAKKTREDEKKKLRTKRHLRRW